MPRFLRKFLSCFIYSREKRHAFANAWGRTRNKGKNNQIILVKADGTETRPGPGAVVPGVRLCFEGDGNVLRLYEPFRFYECDILLQDGSRLEMRERPGLIAKASFCIQNGGRVYIGRGFTSMDFLQITGFDEPGLCVHIGDDCMFSYEVSLRPSDGHAVFERASGRVLNGGKDIVLGEHVWVGMCCCLLKGARIPAHSVVGAHSLVNKAFEHSYSIYAGSPAVRCNKTPVDWDRKNPRALIASSEI